MKKSTFYLLLITPIVLIIAWPVLYFGSKILFPRCARGYQCFPGFRDAPGCVDHLGIIGGCYGTVVIKDLKLTNSISCLNINNDTNNCTRAAILLENNCNQDVLIGTTSFPKSKKFIYFETVLDESGKTYVNIQGSPTANNDNYRIPADEKVSIPIKVNDQEMILSYITKELCKKK